MLSGDQSVIELREVQKKYAPDIVPLENVNLTISKGEFVFLTGPSGAGKSTFLRMLYKAEEPTGGTIIIDGVDLSSLSKSQIPQLRRKVGVIFQDFKLLYHKSVFENVALSLEVLGFKKDQLANRVRQVVEGVGLSSKLHRKVVQLSGGEQQRVAIARAVVNRPPIILADEPTGNLDRKRTMEVVTLMEELNARGATIIFATHDETLFKNTHRRVLYIKDGKIEER
ncbi:MAG: cell division ATP-binding protein FtsE [Thermodesulfobacteria bacterium]|nr:cell division ATP-binding protein FtsE [Thermodesulfobacteriota bacterium]